MKNELAQKLGVWAERFAENWCADRGGILLAKNYRKKLGEVDLIFEERHHGTGEQDYTVLVFLEVRARRGGHALESVNWTKRQRIERTAQIFLNEYQGKAQCVRFDLLTYEKGEWRHYANAW